MKNLFKISLAISVVGICLLLFIANVLQPRLIKISDINNKLLNKKVQIQGEVYSIKKYEESNFQIISIKDETGQIDAIINEQLNITSNQEIIVFGTVTEYEKSLQIQADKMILIE